MAMTVDGSAVADAVAVDVSVGNMGDDDALVDGDADALGVGDSDAAVDEVTLTAGEVLGDPDREEVANAVTDGRVL
jgi:hypothetical protein